MATTEGIANAAERRARMLASIRHSIVTRGYPPTAQELAEGEGVHRSQAQVDLKVMADAGLIELDPKVQRGIRIAGHRIVLLEDVTA
jgi:SOS-response transcriptional repressor LexA